MTKYMMLCDPYGENKMLQLRCLERRCWENELFVLHEDLAEHALKEHQDGPDDYAITDYEIGFDLVEDDPDRDRQKIKCRSCNKVISRTAALDHAKVTHKSDYVYVNLLT
jgi:hypothetical protein